MTSEATVPEAAVEAACRVMNAPAGKPFAEKMRAALTAALPHLSTAIHDAALALEPALEAANALAPMELTEAEAEVWRRGYSTAADWCVAALKGKSIPAPASAALEEETRFLIERLDELEQTISSGEPAEEIYREFNGYVTPSIARLRSALKSVPAPAATHRHKKRGTEYVLLDYGRMQAKGWYERRLGEDRDTWVRVPVDMREVTIYRSVDDGLLWARPREEFEDGRFEAIIPAPAEGNEAEAAAPSLKDAILDAARHVRAQPAGLRGPYVIGDERLDGIIERLGPKSDASGAPKPDPAIAELVGRLEIAKSAIGRLRLDPGASAEDRKDRHAIDQAIAALTASNDRVAELERERDEALATMTRATEAMVECGNLLADEELKREAAEAEVSRLKAGAVTDWQLIESVPKDGRSIAVWLPATATEQPHAFAPVSICEDGTWWDDSTGGQIEPLAATYWAPIHAPSALSNQAEASE